MQSCKPSLSISLLSICHKSPLPTLYPPLLHSLWGSQLNLSTFTSSTPCSFTVKLSLIHTHVFCLASTEFHSSSFRCMRPPLQSLFHLLPTLTTHPNVFCKQHNPQRLLHDLICHLVHHYCKQEGAQS